MLRSKKRRLQRCLYCFWHRACQHVMCPPRHTLCSSRPSASRKPLDPTCHCVWHQLARRCCPAMRTQTKQMLLGTSLLAHSLKQCPCPSISAKCDHSLCRTGACSMPSPNLQQCTWYVGQQASNAAWSDIGSQPLETALPAERHLVGHQQASHEPQRGGLPRAGASNNADSLAPPDLDVGATQDLLLAEGLVHIVQLDENICMQVCRGGCCCGGLPDLSRRNRSCL